MATRVLRGTSSGKGASVMGLVDYPVWFFIPLLVLLLAVEETGFRLRFRSKAEVDDKLHGQIVGARDGLVVLLSLLLGFMLPMSLTRFDLRKQLVVQEANAIGTASLRAQTLPEPVRSKSQELLAQYADARLKFFVAALDTKELEAAQARSKQLQDALWQQALPVAQSAPTAITSVYIQSLNQMIDLSEESLAARENRVPGAIWFMLAFISLLACLTSGYSHRKRFLLSMLVTPLMISIVMALIADLDAPRRGLILVGQQSLERVQSDLNGSIKPSFRATH